MADLLSEHNLSYSLLELQYILFNLQANLLIYDNTALHIVWKQLFPNLNKVVFLDDDVVVQRDLSPLWDIDLSGKVNGAVETCIGEDRWVMSKRFKTYFNFSHPLIASNLDPDECAWAYGMNIFDLSAWRKTSIRDTYHYWLKEVIFEFTVVLWFSDFCSPKFFFPVMLNGLRIVLLFHF